jgi:hypothetical protein
LDAVAFFPGLRCKKNSVSSCKGEGIPLDAIASFSEGIPLDAVASFSEGIPLDAKASFSEGICRYCRCGVKKICHKDAKTLRKVDLIFCLSAIPPFRHSAILPFCYSAIPPFCLSAFLPFRLSAIPPFRLSAFLPFRHSALPHFLTQNGMIKINFQIRWSITTLAISVHLVAPGIPIRY